MALDEGDDIVPVIIGQPLGLSFFIGAKIFGSFFLGWFLGDLVETDLERSLHFRADIPFADLSGDITILAHKFCKGGAVFGDGQTAGHSILAKPLSVLAHH